MTGPDAMILFFGMLSTLLLLPRHLCSLVPLHFLSASINLLIFCNLILWPSLPFCMIDSAYSLRAGWHIIASVHNFLPFPVSCSQVRFYFPQSVGTISACGIWNPPCKNFGLPWNSISWKKPTCVKYGEEREERGEGWGWRVLSPFFLAAWFCAGSWNTLGNPMEYTVPSNTGVGSHSLRISSQINEKRLFYQLPQWIYPALMLTSTIWRICWNFSGVH